MGYFCRYLNFFMFPQSTITAPIFLIIISCSVKYSLCAEKSSFTGVKNEKKTRLKILRVLKKIAYVLIQIFIILHLRKVDTFRL